MTVTKIEKEFIRHTEKTLRSYKQLKANIKILEKENKMLASMIATLPAIEYDSIKVQSSGLGNPTEKDALKLIERRLKVKNELENTKHMIFKIDTAMSSLDEIHRRVVQMSFIEGKSWVSMSMKLDYSERQLRRIRDVAVYKVTIALFGGTVLAKCPKDVRFMSEKDEKTVVK